jgi:hypothetical protein
MTIFGSDVSHFDSPNTTAMFSDGITFQTHKAGGDSPDPELAAWWNYVKGRRPARLLGAYWVLYPGNPQGRADDFLARLDSQCSGWRDGPFLLQADCERWNDDPATTPTITEVNAFCDRLAGAMPKLIPVGYLPPWVYGNSVGAFRYPLWASRFVTGSSHYRALYPGDDAAQWGTYGGRAPAILQYTSNATIGGQSTCDANAFRGTLDQLVALVAPGWSTDMSLTDTDISAIWNTPVLANPDGSATKVSALGILNPTYREARAAHLGTDDLSAALEDVAAQVGSIGPVEADPAAVASALIAAGFNPAALAAALLEAIAVAS